MMQTSKRKREISSCIPCYTRKQKCDRQYPCNRCSRRRQPELCIYSTPQTHTLNVVFPYKHGHQEDFEFDDECWESDDKDQALLSLPTFTTSPYSQERQESSSLARIFGYEEFSELNTMALIRNLVRDDENPATKQRIVPNQTVIELQQLLESSLSRPIIDFLIRYFMTELNWIDQLLYPPWFIQQYERWWSLGRISFAADAEFAILFLRLCCYAIQLLPSSKCSIDNIKGVALVDIRKSCEDLIARISLLCAPLDSRGSLTRVLQVLCDGLVSFSQGHANAFWESLGRATRAARQIGLHLEITYNGHGLDETEREMRRRTLCNLYIWDTYMSRRLDRVPYLSDSLNVDSMPGMNFLPNLDRGPVVPDCFTARILQFQLALFWRTNTATPQSEHDLLAAEERYDKFCGDYLLKIPSVFALQPDRQWDELYPNLPMQRQFLHIAIFEALCWNFRPIIIWKSDQIKKLQPYKQILVSHNKNALAAAALRLLDNIGNFQMMVGKFHTRLPGIVVQNLEAAVILLHLCTDAGFSPKPAAVQTRPAKTDPLRGDNLDVTRAECMQAARKALSRLQTLAEVSNVADMAARTLARLVDRVENCPLLRRPPKPLVKQTSTGLQPYVVQFGQEPSDHITAEVQTCLPVANFDYADIDLTWEDLVAEMPDCLGIGKVEFSEAGCP